MMLPRLFELFCILIVSSCYGINMQKVDDSSSACGTHWQPFKDEKCFTIIDSTLGSFEEAVELCAELDTTATLPIIHSKEEQDFVSNFVFNTQKQVDNIWIGAAFATNGTSFQWTDDSALSYTNWDATSPRNKADYCVQMIADEAFRGKWKDEPCDKKNLIVCQRMQTWSLARLHKTLLDTRKKVRDVHNLINAESRQNSIPIGFVYVQLAHEKSPADIWPYYEWTDASSNYSGLFFRVLGGDAAAFGAVQNDSTPSIKVELHYNDIKNGKLADVFSRNTKTSPIYTGDRCSCGERALSFEMLNNEVRPRNSAIKVWKRTG